MTIRTVPLAETRQAASLQEMTAFPENNRLPALNLLSTSGTVSMLSRSPASLFFTRNLRVIAAAGVPLKAVIEGGPQYVVFYYLTRPRIRR